MIGQAMLELRRVCVRAGRGGGVCVGCISQLRRQGQIGLIYLSCSDFDPDGRTTIVCLNIRQSYTTNCGHFILH